MTTSASRKHTVFCSLTNNLQLNSTEQSTPEAHRSTDVSQHTVGHTLLKKQQQQQQPPLSTVTTPAASVRTLHQLLICLIQHDSFHVVKLAGISYITDISKLTLKFIIILNYFLFRLEVF